ncbi:helix-turn-helix domain-containing protein [Phascolarctobacterium succinatutens]
MTQKELLEQANISQAVIKRIQSGKPIKPVTVGRIASALDCTPADIVLV